MEYPVPDPLRVEQIFTGIRFADAYSSIQNAIDDVPSGGLLWGPFTDTDIPSTLTISKPITWWSNPSQGLLRSQITDGSNVLEITPTGTEGEPADINLDGLHIYGTGSEGDGIYIDAQTLSTMLTGSSIRNLYINAVGNNAVTWRGSGHANIFELVTTKSVGNYGLKILQGGGPTPPGVSLLNSIDHRSPTGSGYWIEDLRDSTMSSCYSASSQIGSDADFHLEPQDAFTLERCITEASGNKGMFIAPKSGRSAVHLDNCRVGGPNNHAIQLTDFNNAGNIKYIVKGGKIDAGGSGGGDAIYINQNAPNVRIVNPAIWNVDTAGGNHHINIGEAGDVEILGRMYDNWTIRKNIYDSLKVNEVGEEAAGAGNSPTPATWQTGDVVENTDDQTMWVKDTTGSMVQIG